MASSRDPSPLRSRAGRTGTDPGLALLDALPGAIWMASLDGGCTYFTPAWLTLRGRPLETELGEGWHDGVHPDDLHRVIQSRHDSMQSGSTVETEYRLRGADGQYRWILERSSALLGRDGKPAGGVGICFDITARESDETVLRNLEKRFRGVFEGAAAGIIQTLLDGRILAVNPAAAAILGYESPEQLAEEVFDVRSLYVTPRRRDDVVLMLRRRGSLRGYRVHLRRRDGSSLLLSANARLILDEYGEPVVIETTFSDTSDRQRSEEMLRDAYEHEHEEGELLRRIDEMKDAFLRAVSHDMRTPLAAILSLAEALKLSAETSPRERLAGMAGQVEDAARMLDHLFTDLLDMDRLSRRTVEPTRRACDVGALIENVVERLDRRTHSVVVSASGVNANVDPAQVERIIENLAVNAIRHTPQGTPVEVRASVDSDGLLIAVDDRGPGVPDERKARIFEPFERGGASDDSGGTGIGLSLVAKFAELHGGRAWVEDRLGGGASFRVLLALPEIIGAK